MAQSTVVIINGLPCSGKSSLAVQLQRELRWALLAKDEIKESLFETLGWRDRGWSRSLSRASYALMFKMAKQLLTNGVNCILEGNFRVSEHEARIERLLMQCSPRCLQILCVAPGPILLERFSARAASGSRHPGHVDLESLPELKVELMSGEIEALRLPGSILKFDTAVIDEARCREFVRRVVQAI